MASRYWQAGRLALVHLICGLAVGFAVLDRRAFAGLDPLLIMGGPVLSSALLGFALLSAVPAVLPAGRIAVPVNLTAPVVFTLLVRASVILWTSPTSAIFRPAEPLGPALLWRTPTILGGLALVELVIFTAWVLAARSRGA